MVGLEVLFTSISTGFFYFIELKGDRAIGCFFGVGTWLGGFILWGLFAGDRGRLILLVFIFILFTFCCHGSYFWICLAISSLKILPDSKSAYLSSLSILISIGHSLPVPTCHTHA